MSARASPRVGVIGAGIAGLSAAVALRRAGWEVEVFEKSAFKNEIGAAIMCTPNATRVLSTLGLDFEATKAVPHLRAVARTGDSLHQIVASDFQGVKKQFGYKCFQYHRVDLHRGLKELAIDPDDPRGLPVKINLATPVKSVNCEEASFELDDGTTVQKDLVVAADGSHSRSIYQINPKAESLIKGGQSIYRFLIPMDRILEDDQTSPFYKDQLPGSVNFLTFKPTALFITYPCRDSTILNVGIVHDTPPGEGEPKSDSKANIWHAPTDKATVLETIAHFHPHVKRIVELADEEHMSVYHTYRRPVLDTFVRGRTVAVGDAAHVMLPTHGSAGAMAIESAAVLGTLLQTNTLPITDAAKLSDTVASRLRLFDELRLPRCNTVTIFSNEGPKALEKPGVEDQIRQWYDGKLPEKHEMPMGPGFQDLLFPYDSFGVAEKILVEKA